jgi:hypothetical protein
MKLWTMAAALTLGVAGLSSAAQARSEAGVSIEISQPGVYGRIDLGRFPSPEVVLPRPVLIRPAPPLPRAAPRPEPVYLWVPPGHRRNWRRHCDRYQACGRPVYFVRDDWYDRHVSQGPGHGRDERSNRGERGDRGERGHGHDRGQREDRRDGR